MKKQIHIFMALIAFGINGSELFAQQPKNCKEILDSSPSSASGLYIIDPDGTGPISTMSCYCDMTTDGGGVDPYFKLQSFNGD